MSTPSATPGSGWVEIIGRATAEAFASAFTEQVLLETSARSKAIAGAAAIRRFFDATRGMYDSIVFVHETATELRIHLEWEGVFQGAPIAGATILTRDAGGKIDRIRLYHRPYEQVIAFSAELARRLDGQMETGIFHP